MSLAIPNTLSPTGAAGMSGLSVEGRIASHVANVADWEDLGDFDAVTGWTVLGNDTITLAVATKHIHGTKSLEFDKVDGAANTIFAGIQNTISSVNASRFKAKDHLSSAVYVSNKADVAYAFMRIGTDSSNYNEWRLADTGITAAIWTRIEVEISATQTTVVGNGWDLSAITYVAIGIAFDAQDDTLADIAFDHLALQGAQLTTT